MIYNERFRISRDDVERLRRLAPELIEERLGQHVLRWYIAQATQSELIVEATICNEPFEPQSVRKNAGYYPGKTAALSIIPTGVGCSIGGYAGDAGPITNLLASTVDYLITNPNAVNASDFICINSEDIIYADGYSIDQFCKGLADFHLPYANRIGLIVERSDEFQLDTIYNLLNAVRATHGINILDPIITREKIGGRCVQNQSGVFVGTVDNTHVLLEACEKLIRDGATAIAVTSNIQDLPFNSYAMHFNGECPNPVGGVEAIISYLLSSRFKLPSAHAPLLNIKQLDLVERVVDARSAAEMASTSGLACILIGLKRAPQINSNPSCRISESISINNVIAIIHPIDCLGGIPVLYGAESDLTIIAVEENSSVLDVTPAMLGVKNVVTVRNYSEAVGVLWALKKGISPESLSRPVKTIRYKKTFDSL